MQIAHTICIQFHSVSHCVCVCGGGGGWCHFVSNQRNSLKGNTHSVVLCTFAGTHRWNYFNILVTCKNNVFTLSHSNMAIISVAIMVRIIIGILEKSYSRTL